MDILQLYQDYSVDFVTEGHKHARRGWVNTICPFCTGNPGYHLGFELNSGYFYCWRCGWHPIIPTISKLINISENKTRILIRGYGLFISKPSSELAQIRPLKDFKLPSPISPLSQLHHKYLESRNFDSKKLERLWELKSTGPISKLEKIDYKNRIIIPFYWGGKMVSFDSRSISVEASHEKRYKACPRDKELIPRKEILYGRQEEWSETGILVEGPTDVWRMGTRSFAVSGIQYTPQQVRIMSQTFKRVAVMFDNDSQAILQANKIVAELRFRKVDAFRVDIENDPGSMTEEEANYLIKSLI